MFVGHEISAFRELTFEEQDFLSLSLKLGLINDYRCTKR